MEAVGDQIRGIVSSRGHTRAISEDRAQAGYVASFVTTETIVVNCPKITPCFENGKGARREPRLVQWHRVSGLQSFACLESRAES